LTGSDDHLARVIDVLGDQCMEPRDALNALREPGLPEPGAGLVAEVHIVMRLCPVISDEDHRSSSCSTTQLEPLKAPDTA
jgi:hypothetical protein